MLYVSQGECSLKRGLKPGSTKTADSLAKADPKDLKADPKFGEFWNWLVTPRAQRKESIPKLAARIGISERHVYNWMRHDITKQMLRDHFDASVANDATELYDYALENAKKGSRGLLAYHEVYNSDFPEKSSHKPVTINIVLGRDLDIEDAVEVE